MLDKSAEDMEVFLETGSFPPAGGSSDNVPVRRRTETRAEARGGRRTPATRREEF